MSHHRASSPADRASIRVLTLTVSDTRVAGTDGSGTRLRELVGEAGFTLSEHRLVKDDPESIRAVLREVPERDLADAVITTGGTGIAPRDVTIEVVAALLEKELDGFGEAFRRLSWDAVGPRAVLSRAVAGVYAGRFVAALPGSPRAVELALREVLLPILEHAVFLLRGRATEHVRPQGKPE